MQIETYSPVRSTVSVSPLDILAPMEPSSGSYSTPRWLRNGKESLATSSDTASLQKAMMDLVRNLYFERLTPDSPAALWSLHLFPLLVDETCFLQATASPREDRRKTRLIAKLYAAFETEPFEDGMYHPAEQIIREALRSGEDQQVLDWLRALSLDTAEPSFAASILRCLGRQTSPGTDSWRAGIVREGLAVVDVEIRDAAVQAAEWWGDRDIRDVLKSHYEPVAWLRDYIQDVVDDLGE